MVSNFLVLLSFLPYLFRVKVFTEFSIRFARGSLARDFGLHVYLVSRVPLSFLAELRYRCFYRLVLLCCCAVVLKIFFYRFYYDVLHVLSVYARL